MLILNSLLKASVDLPFLVDVFVDSDCASVFDQVVNSISTFNVLKS